MSPSWGLITASTEPVFIEQDNDHLGAMLRPCTIIVLTGKRKAPLTEGYTGRGILLWAAPSLAAARVIKAFQGRVGATAVCTWKEFLCYSSRI